MWPNTNSSILQSNKYMKFIFRARPSSSEGQESNRVGGFKCTVQYSKTNVFRHSREAKSPSRRVKYKPCLERTTTGVTGSPVTGCSYCENRTKTVRTHMNYLQCREKQAKLVSKKNNNGSLVPSAKPTRPTGYPPFKSGHYPLSI